MAARSNTIFIASFLTLAILVFFAWSKDIRLSMSAFDSGSTSPNGLNVRLVAGASPSVITVIIENKDLSTPITFLSWNTPFDPQALNSGILRLARANTGEEVSGPGMKLSRKLPPPRDELVEIGAGSTVTKDIALASPWIPTDGGQYRVKMQGRWSVVWTKASNQVTDQELAAVTGDASLQRMFHSESVEMQLSQ